jgi:hypothetical protein
MHLLITGLLNGTATEQDVLLTLKTHPAESIYIAYADELAKSLLSPSMQPHIGAYAKKVGVEAAIHGVIASMLLRAEPLFTGIGYLAPSTSTYASIRNSTGATWRSITRTYPAMDVPGLDFVNLIQRGLASSAVTLFSRHPQLEAALLKTNTLDSVERERSEAETTAQTMKCRQVSFLASLLPMEAAVDSRWSQFKQLLHVCGLDIENPAAMSILRASYEVTFTAQISFGDVSQGQPVYVNKPLAFESLEIVDFLRPYYEPDTARNPKGSGPLNRSSHIFRIAIEGNNAFVFFTHLKVCSLASADLANPHRWPDISQASAQTKAELLAWTLQRVTNTYEEAVAVLENSGLPWDLLNQKTPDELSDIAWTEQTSVFASMFSDAPAADTISWQL